MKELEAELAAEESEQHSGEELGHPITQVREKSTHLRKLIWVTDHGK